MKQNQLSNAQNQIAGEENYNSDNSTDSSISHTYTDIKLFALVNNNYPINDSFAGYKQFDINEVEGYGGGYSGEFGRKSDEGSDEEFDEESDEVNNIKIYLCLLFLLLIVYLMVFILILITKPKK